ncbi:MAG: hypothetical protein RL490_796 [Pseudomonadota bacterium]|jgi:hypothetical protein
MALSTYAANKILDHLNGKAALPMPTAHVALFTSNPGVTGAGAEAAYPGYARVATSAATWTNAAGGASDSAAQISFPAKTGGADVTITHWATFDAAAGGNLLQFGALTAAKTYQTGDVPFIPAGSFDLTAA